MKTKNKLFGIFAILILIIIDQLTKLAAVSLLKDKDDFILIKGVLQLHYLQNNGAAFSILEGKQLYFYIVTVIALVFIFFLLYKLTKNYNNKSLLIIWILNFMAAGAIGNFIDRVRYQYVVDFIYFSLINFPVFNIADCYVTCSVFLLIILILFYYKEEDLEIIQNCIKQK